MALTKITATNIGANAAANNIGYTPVNKAGDVMTGTLNVVGNLRAGYATDVSVVIGSGAVVPNTSVDAHILWGNDTAFGGVNGDLIYVPRTSTGARHRFYTGSGTPVQRMMIDELGRVTKPYQPSFLVGGSSGATGAGLTYIPASNSISYNTGSHLNTTTGVFTAPVTGMYMFSWILLMQNVTNAVQVDPRYYVNGVGYFYGPRAVASSPNTYGDGFICVTGSIVRKLSVNDTFSVSSTVSTGTFNFYNDAYWTHYMGMLIG